jgi:hypothetical protein
LPSSTTITHTHTHTHKSFWLTLALHDAPEQARWCR